MILEDHLLVSEKNGQDQDGILIRKKMIIILKGACRLGHVIDQEHALNVQLLKPKHVQDAFLVSVLEKTLVTTNGLKQSSIRYG